MIILLLPSVYYTVGAWSFRCCVYPETGTNVHTRFAIESFVFSLGVRIPIDWKRLPEHLSPLKWYFIQWKLKNKIDKCHDVIR